MQSPDHNIWKESVFWLILKQYLCHVVGKILMVIQYSGARFLEKETLFLIIMGSIFPFFIIPIYQELVPLVQNVNARGTIYSMWIILRKCEGGCEARLVRSREQIW